MILKYLLSWTFIESQQIEFYSISFFAIALNDSDIN
jgi:hypothetical protein